LKYVIFKFLAYISIYITVISQPLEKEKWRGEKAKVESMHDCNPSVAADGQDGSAITW
jgi:hypothetical protein